MEKKLTTEQLRQIGNKLTAINLEMERIEEHRKEIRKITKEIKEILDSNDENEDS